MSDPDHGRPIDAPQGRLNGATRISATEFVAGALSLVWLLAVIAYFVLAGQGDDGRPFGVLLMLFVVFLPIALIWVAAVTARTIRDLREEAARLQVSVDAMRHAFLQERQSQATGGSGRVWGERRPDDPAAPSKHTEPGPATFASTRKAETPRVVTAPAAAPAAAADQPTLALDAPAAPQPEPLSAEEWTRALNFPDSPEDAEGFRCMRRALSDRDTARLIRAAQDVLTLLAQDGIYMDDLRPDRARPEVWRRFAAGERGRGLAALGGIRDRSSLALTAGRMRNDPVFRDAAHHFLRQFDRSFQRFERGATDAEIADFAETRTARAFMLFGRVAGVFD
ncbi:MAG: hypothetical protein ACK4KW_10140 [Gemmobacter sp.]